MGNKVVILGTAHGVNVAGKCSPDGAFKEYKYSREIVGELKRVLEKAGMMVFVDIEDDVVPGKQGRELADRVHIVNDLCGTFGAENCVYVSVHVNAAGSDGKWHGARGWSVYTSVGQTKGDRLATCLWNAANEVLPHDHKTALRADRSDGDPDYESNFYVLAKTRCAAALTENLFMDNAEDVAYLTSAEGRAAIVELHRRGIMAYLETV